MRKEVILESQSPDDLNSVAVTLLEEAGNRRVFAFYGEMGAGKTTFIKTICQRLNVTDNTSSPTFSIINEYFTSDDKRIYHFDFYRIKTESEALDTGALEYFNSGEYCFIEWPEKIPSLLPEDAVQVNIHVEGNLRKIKVRL